MFTKNIFNQKPDAIVDLINDINEADYKVKMEALKGNQHKIDKNKNGKVDAHDFKILRGEKKVEEASPFDWKNTPSQLKKKPGETTGHDSKKTSTGTEYTKKAPKKPVEESAEQVDEAMRIVSKHGVGTGEHHAVVKRDVEYNEFQAHFYKNGKHMGEGPVYHTDDKKDAQDTAEHQVKKLNAKKNEDFNLEDIDPALIEEFMQTEEFEQLDELSKKTLKSYVGKAVDRVSDTQFRAGKHWEKGNKSSADYESRETLKRMRGIHKATGRMAKEEVEQTDEAATMQPKGPARVDVPAYKRVNMKPLSLKDVVNKSTEKKSDRPNAVKEESEHIGEGERHTLTKKVTNKVNRMEKLLARGAKKQGRTDMGAVMNPHNKSAVAKATKKASDAQVSDTLNRFSKKNEDFSLEDMNPTLVDEFMQTEEFEQLDELSKKTLGDYVKKASHDVAAKGAATRQFANDSDAARKNQDFNAAKKSMDKSDKTFAKGYGRRMGMAKAVDRLTKEDSEQIDELSKETLKSYQDKAVKSNPGVKRGFQRIIGIGRSAEKLNKKD